MFAIGSSNEIPGRRQDILSASSRKLLSAALIFSALLIGLPVAAQTVDPDLSRCNDANPDVALGGCTSLI